MRAPNASRNCPDGRTARRTLIVQVAWALEIDRRVAALDAGTVRIESWEDAKRRIEREIPGR